MNKKVLMIAFYYPPSSGAAVQRTLKASEYLPELGWDPLILTAQPYAYDHLEHSQVIPENMAKYIFRTAAFDVYRHFSYKGKHLGWMASIDRWSTWIPGAILKGFKVIKEHKPDLIWSTTPIPSANIIARFLSWYFKIPWVADYQDPLSYHHYPTNKLKTRIQKSIDRSTIKNCSAAVFATTNAMKIYENSFKSDNPEKFHTIENGYDENNWQQLEKHKLSSVNPIDPNKFSLFYSGVLYPNGRDPSPLFDAIRLLKEKNIINSTNFELVFQGSGDGEKFSQKLKELNINELVNFTISVPYLDSLMYMKKASALVLIQDSIFNLQVPGKLYEYFRTGRPILNITPKESATAFTANQYPLSIIETTPENILTILEQWIESTPNSYDSKKLTHFSRKQKTIELAQIFNTLI